MMQLFNTNRFAVIPDKAVELSDILSKMQAEEIFASGPENVEDDNGEVLYCLYQIHGNGNLVFREEGVSDGMLKLTGNLDSFYTHIQKMLPEGQAMILMQVTEDGGWLAAKGAVVTQDGIAKDDLAGSLIIKAQEMTGDEHYKTDFHAINK